MRKLASLSTQMDGLYFINFTDLTLNLVTTEECSCNSNTLKGKQQLGARSTRSFDVSGHSGDSCFNTTSIENQGGVELAEIYFCMSDGDPSYIQDFIVKSAPGVYIVKGSEHNIEIHPK